MSVLATLQRDGIAFTTAAAFFGDEAWRDLQAATATQVDQSRPLLTMTRQGRLGSAFLPPGLPRGSRMNKTSYLAKLLGDQPRYEPESVWARIASAPALVELARGYLAKPPHLKAFNLWYTVPSSQPPRDSQLWHRDEDDVQILKLFVYLNDVGPDSGPLTYLCGTQHGGRVLEPPTTLEPTTGVPRVSDADMAAATTGPDWRSVTACGSTGTVVLVDTTGWHKGGHGTVDRMVYAVMYTTIPHPHRAAFWREGR